MSWASVKNRFRGGWSGGQSRFVLPPTIVEIEPHFVVGAHLDISRRKLRRIGTRDLEPLTINPLPNRTNIVNQEELRSTLKRVTEVIGNGARRIGLLLPDASVRVAILTLETLPADPFEAETLLRWRMKDQLPYPPEEAKLSYQVLWDEPNSVGLLVVAAKISLLAEFEQALNLKNGELELVLPSTLALLPVVPETLTEAQLLIHVCSGWITTVVVQGGRMRFWRTHPLGVAEAGDLTAGVSSEVSRVLASARDHLQIEVDKVYLCARPPAGIGLAPELATAISKEVVPLDASEYGEPLPTAEKSVFSSVGMPIAGLLANLG